MRERLLNHPDFFRKLRQLLVLFALLLMPMGALAQITVAGNSPDATTGAIEGNGITGTVSYNATSNTLTLTNATINGTIESSVVELTIEMGGINSVTGINGNGTVAACSLYLKKIDTAESATLKYTGEISGFPVFSYGGFNNFQSTINNTTYNYYTTLDFYNLEVAGMTVHNIEGEPGYKGDILNDGTTPKATFDGTSTLTLNGAELNGSVFWGGSADLTINLKGTNSIITEGSCFNSEMAPAISFTKGGDDCSLVLRCDEGNDVLGNFTFGTSPTGEGLYWLPTFNGDYITSATITSTLLGGGSGTESSPFLIKTYDDLKNFATYVNDGTLTTEHVQLSADINCSGKTGFEPIGTSSNHFAGTFDGNGNTISNLSMTDVEEDQVGLFSYNDGTISNLTLSGCTISGGNGSNNYIGAIVAENGGTIQGCTVKSSTVSCKANSQVPFVGGIAGLTTGSITNCVVEDTNVNAVTGDSGASGATALAGGIASKYVSGIVSGCKVKGTTTVTAEYSNQEVSVYAGAIIGNNVGGASIASIEGNTYESTVVTKTKKQGDTDYTTLSGQLERGIGNYYVGETNHPNYDEKGKVELAGTKTVTIYVPDVVGNGGCSAVAGTYYKFVEPNYYVLSGSNFTYSMKPTNSSYKPAFTLSDNTIEVTTDEIEEDNIYDHTEFTFTMPDANLTATLSFAIDLAAISADNFSIEDATYTIDNTTNAGKAQVPTTITVTGVPGATGSTTLTSGTDFTITGYKKGSESVDSPIDAGTYTVTIEGKGNYTGTKDVTYVIKKATNAINTEPVGATLTYTNEAQALITTEGAATFGDVVYSLTETGTYGTAANIKGTDATTYTIYYKVEGTDNYDGIAVRSFTATIGKADPTLTFSPTTATITFGKESEFEKPKLTTTPEDITVTYSTESELVTVDAETGNITPVAVGTGIEIKANFAGSDNYNAGSGSYTLTVAKGTAVVTTAPTAKTLTYTGTELVLVEAGEATNGTMQYKVGADGTYSTDIPTATAASEYTVYYKAVGTDANKFNDSEEASVIVTISAKTLTEDMVSLDRTSFTYNGLSQVPAASVIDGESALTPDDYEISYKQGETAVTEPTDAGDYNVVITGKGNYSGTISKAFTITALETTPTVTLTNPDEVIIYDGTEKKPVVTVTAVLSEGATPTVLTLNTDYTVAYSNNTNAGEATAKVTLRGNYSGTNSINFTIQPKSLTNNDITVEDIDAQAYNDGNEVKPTVVVKDGSTTLTAETDYTLSYSNNTEIAKATDESAPTVTITGKGNYQDAITKAFTITKATATITAPDKTVTYNGSAQAYTGATVTKGSVAIAYYPTADDRTNGSNALTGAPTDAGTYYIKVTQTDEHYTAEPANATFTIEQLSIASAVITLNKTELTYTGEEQTVTVTKVVVGGLEVSADYYEVSGNTKTEAGTYTVTVTAKSNEGAFKNNFTGSATTTFTIKHRTAEISFNGQTFATFYNATESFLIPDGVTAYIITGVNENKVTVQQVSYLKAGVPFLLEGADAAEISDTPDATFANNQLIYADADVTCSGTQYVLYKNEFVKATGTISSGKCYLQITGAAGSRGFAIDTGSSGTTGIEELRMDTEESGDAWYDLQGHRIQKPVKAGLYIKNGKKVVINNK